MATRGFVGRPPAAEVRERLPPGRVLTDDFPVLRFDPIQRVAAETWRVTPSEGARPGGPVVGDPWGAQRFSGD